MITALQNLLPAAWRRHGALTLLGAYLLVAGGWFGWQFMQGRSMASLFFTAEQRAQRALNHEDYALAAQLFPDAYRQGLAHYLDGDFAATVETLAEVDTLDALFLTGNALAHQRDYFTARVPYTKILKRAPDHAAAAHNLAIVDAIIKQMQEMGDSQAPEEGPPPPSEGVDLPEDMAADMEGHKEFGPRPPPEQLSADELLNDPALADLWMQQVQSDPADFLATKFSLQRARARASVPPEVDEPEEEDTP
jgi:Ca-activated chloride channel family protein